MTLARAALRGLLHRRARHVLLLLASAASTAVLCGALVVGDSVRASLRAAAELRLGRTRFALESADRLFTAGLAGSVSGLLGTEVAPVLRLAGSASSDTLSVSGVQILGVDERFWNLLAGRGDGEPPRPGEALVAERLAERLDLRDGGELVLRFPRPLAMPASLSLTPLDPSLATLRLVARRAGASSGAARFSLRSGQAPTLVALVPLGELARAGGVPGRANVLLAADRPEGEAPLAAEAPRVALRRSIRLADLGMSLEPAAAPGAFLLASERVYLDEAVVRSVRAAGLEAGGILAGFANGFAAGERHASYAFVAASAALDLAFGLAPGQVALSRWLAEELGAGEGEELTIAFWAPDGSGTGRLEERTASLAVAGVFPTASPLVPASLVPAFPGLAGAGSCRDWNPGVPVELDRITARDEEYWRRFGMAPKAVVSLQTAQELWASRYGSLTALELAGAAQGTTQAAVESAIVSGLDPASVGLAFRDVRREALAASAGSVDFGELFLALSFVIVAASVLLTAMLFGVSLLEREREIGTLGALGFRPARVRALLAAEGLGLSAFGAVPGAAAGVGYAALLLEGLRTLWRGAVGPIELVLEVRAGSLLAGAGAGLLASAVATGLASRIARREPVALLHRARLGESPARGRRALSAAAAAGLAALGAVGALGLAGALSPVASFAAAGASCLLLLVSCAGLAFLRAGSRAGRGVPTPAEAGFRNTGRRLGRNLVAAASVAAGVFAVAAVGLNRVEAADPADRRSGSGGFALFVECTAPLPPELLRGPDAVADGGVLALELREGDDASCLNLSRVELPRLYGVEPRELAERGSFSFAAVGPGVDSRDPWRALETELPPGEIAAVADAGVLEWSLRKGLGDTLSYTDDFGAEVRVRLVGSLARSVFQGGILVSRRDLRRHFPGSAGVRLLLVDAPEGRTDDVAAELRRVLRPYGAAVQRTDERLAAFNTVQNTWLSVFLLLGGMGVLLGSLCLGLVVARNLEEARAEIALLEAVGFSRADTLAVVMAEQLPVLLAGTLAGLLSAVPAVYPVLSGGVRPGALAIVAALAAGVLAVGVLSVLVAFGRSTRRELLGSLRAD